MSDNTSVTSRMNGNIQVLSIKGRMTYDFVPEIKGKIQKQIKDADGYVIDLMDVVQIDSVGLGLIVNTAKKFISNRNKMVIVITDVLIQELFVISKLDEVFEMTRSVADAEKILEKNDDLYWAKISEY